jgi:hypothetical protein
VDRSLNKRFAIYENLSVEFRAEAHNAFNHTNFALPTGGIADITNSNTFGVIPSTATPRARSFHCAWISRGSSKFTLQG